MRGKALLVEGTDGPLVPALRTAIGYDLLTLASSHVEWRATSDAAAWAGGFPTVGENWIGIHVSPGICGERQSYRTDVAVTKIKTGTTFANLSAVKPDTLETQRRRKDTAMSDEPFYSPNRKPPAARTQRTVGELLWEVHVDHVFWRAELFDKHTDSPCVCSAEAISSRVDA
jgi:hypothetical protein